MRGLFIMCRQLSSENNYARAKSIAVGVVQSAYALMPTVECRFVRSRLSPSAIRNVVK